MVVVVVVVAVCGSGGGAGGKPLKEYIRLKVVLLADCLMPLLYHYSWQIKDLT